MYQSFTVRVSTSGLVEVQVTPCGNDRGTTLKTQVSHFVVGKVVSPKYEVVNLFMFTKTTILFGGSRRVSGRSGNTSLFFETCST